MNSFEDLILQLNKFVKKYHAIQVVKGSLLFFCYIIVLTLFIGVLEFCFSFSNQLRFFLFFSTLLILLGGFFSLIIIPFGIGVC